jgi:hypothetical protein
MESLNVRIGSDEDVGVDVDVDVDTNNMKSVWDYEMQADPHLCVGVLGERRGGGGGGCHHKHTIHRALPE